MTSFYVGELSSISDFCTLALSACFVLIFIRRFLVCGSPMEAKIDLAKEQQGWRTHVFSVFCFVP